jgi:hypothetical protein
MAERSTSSDSTPLQLVVAVDSLGCEYHLPDAPWPLSDCAQRVIQTTRFPSLGTVDRDLGPVGRDLARLLLAKPGVETVCISPTMIGIPFLLGVSVELTELLVDPITRWFPQMLEGLYARPVTSTIVDLRPSDIFASKVVPLP